MQQGFTPPPQATSQSSQANQPKVFIEFLSPSEIRKYQPPPDLVLVGDNHIVRGSVFILGGPPGVGKSRADVGLAESGVTGYEWFGLKPHCKFRTLIIQNENGRFRLRQELDEINEPLLEDSLRICPPPPFGMCFWKSEFRDQLRDFANSFDPQLVWIDPWNAVARDEKAKEYLETFDIIRDVFPPGDNGPALGINAHTRKPTVGERANGRALLNLLSGSYVLGSIPRSVFIMQHASDSVYENRVVWTCCKNNDGKELGQSAWIRQNGLFSPVADFDWKSWNQTGKEQPFSIDDLVDFISQQKNGVRKAEIVEEISKTFGIHKATVYRRFNEAEKAKRIKCQKGTDVYVAV